MKKLIAFLIFCSFSFSLFAHDLNYENVILKHWVIDNSNQSIDGSFYMLKDGKVYIEDAFSKLQCYPVSSLSKDDQQYVQRRNDWVKTVNKQLDAVRPKVQSIPPFLDFIFWAVLLLICGLAYYTFKVVDKAKRHYLVPIVSVGAIALMYSFSNKRMPAIETTTNPLMVDSAFKPFKPKVNTHWDNSYFYIESKGIPDHKMMLGITGWQQQVPIPQCYIGNNAWQIPLNPIATSSPVPVNQNHFLRGAVAIAVNGIPIFNPYTNTGVDALKDGQLDSFGGHCGRADDYHYHIAPLVLYNQTSVKLPIAYALDGYAVYGAYEPDGSTIKTLDNNHGHMGNNGLYHYHGTKDAPYMIGKMVGKVIEDTTLQIVPQAHANPVRPGQNPLKGAVIKSCLPNTVNNGYALIYTLNGLTDSVVYNWTNAGQYNFSFYTSSGVTKQSYSGFKQCSVPASLSVNSALENSLLIFPNPVKGNFHFEFSNKDMFHDIRNISIYSTNGELVYYNTGYSGSINVKNLKQGVYFIKVQLGTGALTRRILVD